MNHGSAFPQTDPSRHRHTDFTDHLPSMARHDGRPEDVIAPLPDMELYETLLLTIQDGAVHLLETAPVGVHFQATRTRVMFVEPNVGNFGIGVCTPGHREGTQFLATEEQGVLNHQ